ncbi:solute:sodium symporter family transporter [Flavihumibacter petaseus]|uniref:Putative SSS family transporter n=1 Tax=Flavihumibacter petaseus NBRC 106054 TaxID=1220578 RepID=A0A0E9MW34_9BACT|nr:solute:sodium symporter family transporter [Flavihumibacter petaseus]GAO41932.1 putative SSS family transporter [Flavihumibacter petaseus NBRC 106054]
MNATALLTFLVLTGIVALVSWLRTKKEQLNTLSGLFFANRKLGFIAVGSGLLFANINASTFIGENELSYTNNMSVMGWGVTAVFAMLLVSEFIMPIYLRSGIATTPDYLEMRYDRQTKLIVSLIFLINYMVNLLPAVLYGGAVGFNGLFHFSEHLQIDYWTSIWILVWIMGGLGGLYSLLGGMKAITVSDTAIGFGMFTGGLLLPWLAVKHIGGGSWQTGLQTVLNNHTEHFNSIGSAQDAIPFGTLFTGMLLVNLYYWGTEQYIVQQVLGSRDLATCQKGIALACAGKLLCPLLINVPGVLAVHLYNNLGNSAEVFPRLVGDVSPPVYTGYMAALLFGAALTTFNAGLNSASTLFMLNIYQPRLKRRKQLASQAALVASAKRFEVFVCLVAMLIAPMIIFAKGGFYTYVQKVGGLFSIPIFTIIFVGFVTRRVPPVAAKAGLLFFIVTYGITQFFLPVPLHFLHVLAILFVLTIVLMLAIGKWKPLDIPYERRLSAPLDVTPWKSRHLYAVLLILGAILLYLLFSPLGLAKQP